MLKLVSYPAASPFCVKAMCLLNMAGAEWEMNATSDPRKATKRKLPLLIDGEVKIPDSEDVRDYLAQKYAVDFDEGLSAALRATSRAVIRMCDEHLYFILVCDRWLNDANWAVLQQTFFCYDPALAAWGY